MKMRYNMKEKTVILKVYLKSKRKPFIFEYDREDQIDLKQQLLTHDVIQIGPITFLRAEFEYAEIT